MKSRTISWALEHVTLTVPCNSPEEPAALRTRIAVIVSCMFAITLAFGCASTKVSDREQLVTGKIPRPGHIWVHDFVATPGELPPNSTLAGEDDVDTAPQTTEQIAEGKKLGSEIAAQLVEQIRGMGMPGARARGRARPQINDLVIRGYLLSIKEGSRAKRVIVGFGSGASALHTMVEGFQVTAQGERKLGSGNIDAEGGKSPGATLGVVGFLATKNPAGLIVSGGMHLYGEESGSSTVEGRAKATATEIADVLKKRFQEQGWIAAD